MHLAAATSTPPSAGRRFATAPRGQIACSTRRAIAGTERRGVRGAAQHGHASETQVQYSPEQLAFLERKRRDLERAGVHQTAYEPGNGHGGGSNGSNARRSRAGWKQFSPDQLAVGSDSVPLEHSSNGHSPSSSSNGNGNGAHHHASANGRGGGAAANGNGSSGGEAAARFAARLGSSGGGGGPASTSANGSGTLALAIMCPTQLGQRVDVVGSIPALGAWELAGAMRTTWTEGNVWRAELEVPEGGTVEFKAVMVTEGGPAVWQGGPNASVTVPGGERVEHYVEFRA